MKFGKIILATSLLAGSLFAGEFLGYSDLSKILLATLDVNEKVTVYEKNLEIKSRDILE